MPPVEHISRGGQHLESAELNVEGDSDEEKARSLVRVMLGAGFAEKI